MSYCNELAILYKPKTSSRLYHYALKDDLKNAAINGETSLGLMYKYDCYSDDDMTELKSALNADGFTTELECDFDYYTLMVSGWAPK